MGRVSAELGAKVYLDTNIVIYAIEGFADLAVQIQLCCKPWTMRKLSPSPANSP